ncbi:MAG: DUF2275 domain-containing protein [Deltaproteobacteria bacterium]|nr:DUF2275 domain-containing protein [Deltaproteobacteria bacterium]
MDHDSIRHKLSAYLDGAVTPAEKSLIEKHLEECRDCRNSLHELEKTVLHVRSLGEVEPPPWLAVKVMARVREEAGREKGLLRRLLEMPLRWQVPVEAAALVFLSVTGYLVYQNVSSEMKQVVPQVGVLREEPVSSAPSPAASRKIPEQPELDLKKPSAAREKKQGEESAPLSLPTEETFPDSRQEELEPLLPSPEQAPFMVEDKGLHDFRLQERGAAKSASPPADFSRAEKETRVPSGLARREALPAAGIDAMRLELLVADADSGTREIERVTIRSGGVLLRRDIHSANEGVLVVRLQRKAVGGYIELLKKLGEVRGPVSVAPEGPDTVEIYLAVTTGRE